MVQYYDISIVLVSIPTVKVTKVFLNALILHFSSLSRRKFLHNAFYQFDFVVFQHNKGVKKLENKTIQSVPAFGYELIRDHVLSNILGKHENDILYWAGKDIARKFPLFSMTEAPAFFKEAGWGDLYLEKESKDEAIYKLKFEEQEVDIEQRCFRLEAGFLAAQKQRNNGFLTECYDEQNKKHHTVTFTVKWDLKEPVEK